MSNRKRRRVTLELKNYLRSLVCQRRHQSRRPASGMSTSKCSHRHRKSHIYLQLPLSSWTVSIIINNVILCNNWLYSSRISLYTWLKMSTMHMCCIHAGPFSSPCAYPHPNPSPAHLVIFEHLYSEYWSTASIYDFPYNLACHSKVHMYVVCRPIQELWGWWLWGSCRQWVIMLISTYVFKQCSAVNIILQRILEDEWVIATIKKSGWPPSPRCKRSHSKRGIGLLRCMYANCTSGKGLEPAEYWTIISRHPTINKSIQLINCTTYLHTTQSDDNEFQPQTLQFTCMHM